MISHAVEAMSHDISHAVEAMSHDMSHAVEAMSHDVTCSCYITFMFIFTICRKFFRTVKKRVETYFKENNIVRIPSDYK